MTDQSEIIAQAERAVLVGVITAEQNEKEVDEFLNELAFLTETAGGICYGKFIQKINRPNPGTFIGTGKLAEIVSFVKDNSIDVIIFDDELSPSQQRNIEDQAGCKVLTRTNLILDIFAQRAVTSYARIQVELAQYEYLLPRLTRMWTHLERQQGGIGLRGPGETEIETDRRIIREKIAKLKDQLLKIDRQMTTQRKNRGKLVRVALVGYTNVGKSTLMNLLSKSDIFVENKLFATLDTTTRKVIIGNLPFLLSDTVGFIRKLPHNLVESFKSTLDEAREADILLHVADISHKNFEAQLEVVRNTLHEIGAVDKLVILVFNKIDSYSFIQKEDDDLTPATEENISLEELMNTWIAKENQPCIFISAREKTNIDAFRDLLYRSVKLIHEKRYPYDQYIY
ncbi:MAG: GTPase HflX [Bacteroidia bacterium]|nr:GTPase HflX [Bacteroidia bacterium]